MWFVNLLATVFTLVRYAAPVVVGFVVFGVVSNIVAPMVVGAFLSNVMVPMFSGACGIIVGTFLAGICWR